MTVRGLLIRIEPRVWTVDVDGREVACSLRPRLFDEKPKHLKNPVAVGDRVEVTLEGDQGIIERIEERTNALARPLPNDRKTLQVTAANVDLLVIVSATKDPPLRLGLIDRYLVAAERQGMDAVLVLNKTDRGKPAAALETLALYESLGYPVLPTSAKDDVGIDALRDTLRGRTSLFVGHSGVGKSSLMNAIDPALGLRVGKVAKHGRGRHTTTSVSLFRLEGGGHVVDSPGIRGFGLFDVPPAELALLMPDLRPFASDCRYPDCSHDHEPDCGVRDAADRGDVTEARYTSYRRMLDDILGRGDDEDE